MNITKSYQFTIAAIGPFDRPVIETFVASDGEALINHLEGNGYSDVRVNAWMRVR